MIDRKQKISISDFFIIMIFTVILFQNPLMKVSSVFRFVDELLFMVSVVYITGSIMKKGVLNRQYAKMFVVMALIIGLGILSNSSSDVKRTSAMIALDIIFVLKSFICFIAAGMYFNERGFSKRQMNLLVGEVHLILWTALICMCISQVADIGMTYKVRYGIKCFKFIYGNPGMWSQYCIIFLLILTAELQYKALTQKRILYFSILIVVWLTSCRSRAFATVALWIFLMVIGRKIKDVSELDGTHVKKTIKGFMQPQYIALAVAVVLLLGWSQIQEYFGDEAVTARSLLVKGGISIMRDYFPLGSGFGTFGTEVAASYYSPLYYKYGLNSFWALAEGGTELVDCYWPAIAAELGFFGIILMLLLIVLFIKKFVRDAKGKKYYLIVALTYSAYLLMSSTATAIFSSYITAGFFVIAMALINVESEKQEGEY